MKKSIIILFIIITSSFSAVAQRHLKGIKGMDLLGGVTAKGYFGEAGYLQYISSKMYFTIGARFEAGKIDSYKFNSISLNPSINYTIWKPTEFLFINLKGGASGYFDTRQGSNSADPLLINSKTNTFNYGVFGGVEIETFLSDKVIWIVNFRQNYNFKNYPGKQIFYIGTGIRLAIF